MNIFLEASRLKLRFQTSTGLLTVEQLWDLKQIQLETIAKNLFSSLKKDDTLDFLDNDLQEESEEVKQNTLRFNIVKEIYTIKKEERKSEKEKQDAKIHNQKIMALIAEKQDESLKSMSVEDLQKLLK